MVNISSLKAYAAIIDVAIGIFLSICAVRGITTPSFASIAVGVIEFATGIAIGSVAILRFPLLDRELHFLYTFAGRGAAFVLFGTLGLSTSDPFRYFFSLATIAIGFLYVGIGIFVCQAPAPCIDCGEFGTPKTTNKPAASTGGTSASPAAATPFLAGASSGKPKQHFGGLNPWTPKPENGEVTPLKSEEPKGNPFVTKPRSSSMND